MSKLNQTFITIFNTYWLKLMKNKRKNINVFLWLLSKFVCFFHENQISVAIGPESLSVLSLMTQTDEGNRVSTGAI